MSETTFKDRVSEMIKNKISPTHTMDDECDQMWTEILIQVFGLLCLDCSVLSSDIKNYVNDGSRFAEICFN